MRLAHGIYCEDVTFALPLEVTGDHYISAAFGRAIQTRAARLWINGPGIKFFVQLVRLEDMKFVYVQGDGSCRRTV